MQAATMQAGMPPARMLSTGAQIAMGTNTAMGTSNAMGTKKEMAKWWR